MSSPITVIELWPTYFDCQGCGRQVRDAKAWPFYEDFLPPETRSEGYVPLCLGCADRVADRFACAPVPLAAVAGIGP